MWCSDLLEEPDYTPHADEAEHLERTGACGARDDEGEGNNAHSDDAAVEEVVGARPPRIKVVVALAEHVEEELEREDDGEGRIDPLEKVVGGRAVHRENLGLADVEDKAEYNEEGNLQRRVGRRKERERGWVWDA